MGFDLERWQASVRAELGSGLAKMKQLGVNSAYGYVAALTLLPVLQAAAGGEGTLPALLGVAGGVGGNLLAEQLQRWQDRANAPETPGELAMFLVEQAARDAALREELDAVFRQVQLMVQAQQALSPQVQQWLRETLRAEMQQIKRGEVAALLHGDGAIAQGDGAWAIGAGSAGVQGNVGGDLLMPGASKTEIRDGVVRPAARALRENYLRWLMNQVGQLPLDAVDRRAVSQGAEPQLALEAVYTALLTQSQEQTGDPRLHEREARRLSALAQANRQERLVLLGDPGSGKSTFLNFVALCLAGEGLGDARANLRLLTAPLPKEDGSDEADPQPWTHGALLPVRVVLREFAARGLSTDEAMPSAETLWHFIAAELAREANLAEFVPHLYQEVRERGVLVLLDGLDEVPEADHRREQIKAVVEAFAQAHPRCRLLVTSRTYAYQQQAWRLRGFESAVLAPLTAGQVRRFVARWYEHVAEQRAALDREQAQGRAVLLQTTIERSSRLRELAARPLLLTLMASLHAWRSGSLPERREQLYAEAVELLLDRWERQRIIRNARGEIVQIEPSLSEWLAVEQEQV